MVRAPGSPDEIKNLLQGNYPRELIAAQAIYYEAPETEEAIPDDRWPEYHHRVRYILTVN